MPLDPVIFTIGPFAVRWYGVFMGLSVLIGFYYFLKHGRRIGYDEDNIYNLAIIVVISGLIGARLIYVLTNLDFFIKYREEIIRIDHGGLSFHGALLGGFVAGYLYIRKAKMNIDEIADLVVPGLCVGYILVRLANILNMENMGRAAEILSGERMPAQLIGSVIGLLTLFIHNYLARKNPPPGYLWWGYIFYYSLLRGVIEETVRDNPIYLHLFISEKYGIGALTLTQLITPMLMLIAWWQIRRVKRKGNIEK